MGKQAAQGIRIAVLPLALVAIAPFAAMAEPPEVYISLGSRFSDNIENDHLDEQNDIENRFALRGNYQTDPGKCIASIGGELAHSIYAQDTFDPETQVDIDASGRCELASGLFWHIDNQLQDVNRSARQNDTPDNRTRKNVFSTGPDYRWRLTSQDIIQLSSRYENTEFSDPEDADSDRVTGSVSWNHLFAPDFSAGLATAISDVELDTRAEIQTTSASVIFNKRWAATELSGSLGISEIETEFRNVSQSSDGFIADLDLSRTLDSGGTAYLRASRELTDQTSDFDLRFDEFTFELTESNALEATTIETGLNKPLSNGDMFTVSGYASRSDFLESDEQEDRSGLRLGYTRRMTSRLSASAGARYEYITFESDQSDDQITGLDLGLTYAASRSLNLQARVGRNERTSDIAIQEFEENWLLLSVDYRLR